MKTIFVMLFVICMMVGSYPVGSIHAETYDGCPSDYPYLWSDGYCWNQPEVNDEMQVNNEDECYYTFSDTFDTLYDVLFYQVVFNLPFDADLNDYPYAVQDSLKNDFEYIESEYEKNNCSQYTYLLESDEYLKYRYDTLEYNADLAQTYLQYYHNESDTAITNEGIADKILKHKDLLKLLATLLI